MPREWTSLGCINSCYPLLASIKLLNVDDDAPGIAEKYRQRAFDSFVQLDDTDGKTQGFGLG
jgi:K+-sensing histidine kinase KdpD